MVDEMRQNPPLLTFLLAPWLGTALAGGVFGLLFVVVEGLIGPYGSLPTSGEDVGPLFLAAILAFGIGSIIAGLFAIVAFLLIATLAKCFRLSRFRIPMAVIAGAATGVVSCLGLSSLLPVDFGFPTVFAGIFGGLGSSLMLYMVWYRPRPHAEGTPADSAKRWQFGVRDMLLYVTTFAILLALISSFVAAMKSIHEEDRRTTCEQNLRTLALSLSQYHSSYGSLPPAVLVDEDDRPVLSWRVTALDVVYNDFDFSTKLDFSKPWDDPANMSFLSSGWMGHMQCPSIGRKSAVNTTHYVAVTGPGTQWTEVGSLDRDSQQDAILVIEWPPSDIHWAEPRDVTADEFLAWFESKDRRHDRVHRHGLHYIDARGEVGTLPWNIDANQLRRLLTPHQAAGGSQ